MDRMSRNPWPECKSLLMDKMHAFLTAVKQHNLKAADKFIKHHASARKANWMFNGCATLGMVGSTTTTLTRRINGTSGGVLRRGTKPRHGPWVFKSSHGLWLLSWITSVILIQFLNAVYDKTERSTVEQLPFRSKTRSKVRVYKCILTKGFPPYDCKNENNKLYQNKLPSHEAFFNKLKNKNITDEEYKFVLMHGIIII